MNERRIILVLFVASSLIGASGCLSSDRPDVFPPKPPLGEPGEVDNLTLDWTLQGQGVRVIEAEFRPVRFGAAVKGQLDVVFPDGAGARFLKVNLAWRYADGHLQELAGRLTIANGGGANVHLRHDGQGWVGPIHESNPIDGGWGVGFPIWTSWLPDMGERPHLVLTAAYSLNATAIPGRVHLELNADKEQGPHLMPWGPPRADPHGIGLLSTSDGAFTSTHGTSAELGDTPLTNVDAGRESFNLSAGGAVFIKANYGPARTYEMTLNVTGPLPFQRTWGSTGLSPDFEPFYASRPGTWNLTLDAAGINSLVVVYIQGETPTA